MTNPLVSLISPVYNSMPYLQDFLDCLVKQTWRPLQVILVDDGSKDDSAKCLRDNQKKLEQAGINVDLVFCPHQGQAAAVNAALHLIKGDFFTWCDSDDLMTPDCVGKKAQWLIDHPEIGMVRNNGTVIDGDKNNILSESARPVDRQCKNIFEDLFLDLTYCYAGCYMIRTELFFSCYPNKQIPISPEGQNLQLLLPPASKTPCGYIDDKLHIYCRRASGHSSQNRSYQENLKRLQNFTSLKLTLLDYCDCDRAYYEKLAKDHEEIRRKNLLFSAVQRARKELEK